MQLICGIPQIERGLQNAFDRAGRDTNVDIEALWHRSLARLVFLTIGYIKKLALTDTVGCLKWFVEQLGAFCAMRGVVQWIDRARYRQLGTPSLTVIMHNLYDDAITFRCLCCSTLTV